MTQPAASDRRYLLLAWAYFASQLIPVVLFLAFLVGSLALSGGQAVPNKHAIWDAVIPFPLFVVPDWLSLTLAVIGVVLVVPFVLAARITRAPYLNPAFAYTMGAGIANSYFALAFADDGHWLAVGLAVVSILVVLVRLLTVGAAYDRLRRSGLLLEFGITRQEERPARFQIDLPPAWERVDDGDSRAGALYEPRSATRYTAPAVRISCLPLKAARRTSFSDAVADLAGAAEAPAEQRGRTLLRWSERSAAGRSVSYAFPSADDPRRGLVFTTSIGAASAGVTDAITEFSDAVMETFAWR